MNFDILELSIYQIGNKLTTFGAFKMIQSPAALKTKENCKLHNQIKNENYYCHVPWKNFDCGEKDKKKIFCQIIS